MTGVAGAAVAAAVAAASASPVPSPLPAPSASPAVAATPSPAVAPNGIDEGPAPGASPAPAPQPTPVYLFVFRPTLGSGAASPSPALPQIAEIDVNAATLSAPGPLDVRVLASPSVTRVVAQALGRSIAIPPYGPGEFRLDGEIPTLPFFLHGRSFEIDFIASAADGATSSIELPFTLR